MKIKLKIYGLLALGILVFVLGTQAAEKAGAGSAGAGVGAGHSLRAIIVGADRYGASLLHLPLNWSEGVSMSTVSAGAVSGEAFAGAGSSGAVDGAARKITSSNPKVVERRSGLLPVLVASGMCDCLTCSWFQNNSCALDTEERLAQKRAVRPSVRERSYIKLQEMQRMPRFEGDTEGAGLRSAQDKKIHESYQEMAKSGSFF